ncbi:MIP family channel protein [Stieleria sp. TO1_6]|uniref:MIP/aquaporin family protein n=1 Tax=Stieleria tagensis TaxID=2956795 RepID=UPI00209B7CA2|nr:MIP family channel protein [Stieleria tagensis]MCO8125263.1 MIP family channel protein [Stieleria tagensis]
MNKYLAEAIGTFILVFVGTGAVVVNAVYDQSVTLVGVSITFAMVVATMIYSIGDISGAHINPAVSIAFWVARRFEGKQVLPYIASQCVGAIAGSALLRILFPDQVSLGETLPSGPWLQSFVFEIILTFILMFVILNVTVGAKEKGITAGLAIGGVIAFEVLVGGPVSGASMNPARSIGPALVLGQLQSLWIYLVAPAIGAILAVPVCAVIRTSPVSSTVVCTPIADTAVADESLPL